MFLKETNTELRRQRPQVDRAESNAYWNCECCEREGKY